MFFIYWFFKSINTYNLSVVKWSNIYFTAYYITAVLSLPLEIDNNLFDSCKFYVIVSVLDIYLFLSYRFILMFFL